MKALRNTFIPLLASALLASCGGGGGGTHNAFTPSGDDTTLTLVATTTTLPQSPFTVGEEQSGTCPGNYPGSPYISEVTVTWRHRDGSLVTGTSKVNVATSPVNTISFSTLITQTNSNPQPCTDEFHTLLGSGPVNVTAGTGTIFVHAGQTPGPGTLTVTAVDPVSGHNISAQLTITVVGASSGVPSSITALAESGVYVANSGGPQSTVIQAAVTDGSGAFLSAPNGVDNVQFHIVGPANSDAILIGTDAAGHSQSGTTVNVPSHNGIALVTFQAGSQQGPVQVQAIADRGDNNVDNSVQTPISSTTTVVVSDGKLYALQLTSPVLNGILVDRVSTQTTLINQNGTFPLDPNAIYSFTVSAHAVDHEGNPVLPGTQIRFGVVDTPTDINGDYLISGVKGDPQEGGTLFTATDGHFRTAAGGVFLNDTLLVFGKLVPGNEDLESASRVTSILSETSLTVATPFNLNDGTGATVNYGPVLPYIVGRAEVGNISSPAFTDANGTASTTLNYPVSQLGHAVAVWAQATGSDEINGQTKLVTDIVLAAYPGVAPAKIIVSPNPIPGNITTTVLACVQDEFQEPIQGVQLQFSFSGLGVGSGTLDGINGSGNVPQLTDASGCVSTTVKTTGIVSSNGTSGAPTLTFTGANTSTSTPIVASGSLVLTAIPSVLGGTGGTVTLTLTNSNGTPVPNVQLQGSCSGATIGIVSGPTVTNAQGQSVVVITADLNQPNQAGSGTCTFQVPGGTPSVLVNLQGIDPCKSQVSPLPTGCTATTTSNATVTMNITSNAAASASFSSSPAGLSCSLVNATTATCTATVAAGTSYTLTAAIPSGETLVGWSGNCTQSSATTATLALATSATSASCTLNVSKP